MKSLLSVIVLFSATSSFAGDISMKAKQIILEAITENVYFEDEGAERAPQTVADFTFKKVNANLILVTGSSFSEWDLKPIQYDCTVNVLTGKSIESTSDIDVSCSLQGENWPRD